VDLAKEDVRAPHMLDDLVGVHDLELAVLDREPLVHVGHDHLEATRPRHVSVVLEQLHARDARSVEVAGNAPGELTLMRAYVEQGAADSLWQLAQDAPAVLLLAQPENAAEVALRLLAGCAGVRRELIGPAIAGLWW
jgi:hypothetical protein